MQDPIKILMSGVAKMNVSGQFKAHSHPHYQLNSILRGSYEYIVDGTHYMVEEGDTILLPSNSTHSITLLTEGPGYYFEVKFSTFSRKDKELCETIPIVVQKDTFSPALMRELFEEEEHLTPVSDEIRLTYLYAILYKLAAPARRDKGAPSKYIEVSAYSEPVRDTIRFLEKNYEKHLTLEDIVAQTDLKKSALSSRFKEETSVTIFECLAIIRIRKAAELLAYTELSLADICQATGFVNLTHFNRVFTKHIMIPPGQYRKHLDFQNLYWADANMAKSASPIALATLDNRKIDVSSLGPIKA